MYLRRYKGQFLIIHKPKNTFGKGSTGRFTGRLSLSTEIQLFSDFLSATKNFLPVKNDYRNQDNTVRDNLQKVNLFMKDPGGQCKSNDRIYIQQHAHHR